jgi:hypothetical protein
VQQHAHGRSTSPSQHQQGHLLSIGRSTCKLRQDEFEKTLELLRIVRSWSVRRVQSEEATKPAELAIRNRLHVIMGMVTSNIPASPPSHPAVIGGTSRVCTSNMSSCVRRPISHMLTSLCNRLPLILEPSKESSTLHRYSMRRRT